MGRGAGRTGGGGAARDVGDVCDSRVGMLGNPVVVALTRLPAGLPPALSAGGLPGFVQLFEGDALVETEVSRGLKDAFERGVLVLTSKSGAVSLNPTGHDLPGHACGVPGPVGFLQALLQLLPGLVSQVDAELFLLD